MYTGLSEPLTITGLDQVSGGSEGYRTTKYSYDRFGNPVTMTDPLGQTERSTYDLTGALLSQEDRTGSITENVYDVQGRLLSSSVTPESGTGGITQSYTYARNGAIQSVSDGTATITYEYDEQGNVVYERTGTVEKSYTYDSDGRRTRFELTVDGETALSNVYTYDALGRLSRVTGGGAEAEYTYDANGNVSAVDYGNGTSERYAYNQANLTVQVQNLSEDSTISQYDYTYDLAGRQSSRTDKNGDKINYSYDDLGQLTMEAGPGWNTYQYEYDSSYNRVGTTTGELEYDYGYDLNNRITSMSVSLGRLEYQHDANGNLIAIEQGWGVTPSRPAEYGYDVLDRLIRVATDNATTVYQYGPDGLRSSKTTDDGIIHTYVWDGDQLVWERSSSVHESDPVVELTTTEGMQGSWFEGAYNAYPNIWMVVDGIVYGPDDIEVLVPPQKSMAAEERDNSWDTAFTFQAGGVKFQVLEFGGTQVLADGVHEVQIYLQDPEATEQVVEERTYLRGIGLVASEEAGKVSYYHHNAHGDVVQLTNENGSVIQQYDYDAFGVERGADPKDTNPFRYCGEYFDQESGFYYLRARYYDPAAGRFITEDTVTGTLNHAISLNLYIYCWNSPILYSDGTGNIPSPIQWFKDQTREGKLDGVISFTIGAEPDEKGIYHIRQDYWQSLKFVGYNGFYDMVFGTATQMKTTQYQFEYREKMLVFWVWKGDYINLGAGAELGIYYGGGPHWKVGKEYALPVTLQLNYNGKQRFYWDPGEENWWITGFDPSLPDVDPDSLEAIFRFDFSERKDMFYALYESNKDYTEWSFDFDHYTATLRF